MSTQSSPFLSVCIPAYQRTHYLERLLQSLAGQRFRNFEVILSDDSRDDAVEQLAQKYTTSLPLVYFKNNKALGTPANWNFAIAKARGEWIKLMHDDDWLSSSHALQTFADATREGKKFVFSAYTNHFESGAPQQTVRIPAYFKQRIGSNPSLLIVKNVIGPPSVTLVHRSVTATYDERLKWRVDTDFYERVIAEEKDFHYINEPLVNVGISESQVTQSCLYKPEVELPEGFILLQKNGTAALRNILVYDAWWRLMRNMHIRHEQQLYEHTQQPWPAVITSLVRDLAALPQKALSVGVLSKLFMSFSYLKNRHKI